MKRSRHKLFGTLLAAVILFAPAPVAAQADPFAAVTSIVDWFERLNNSWSRIVDAQERRQLLQSIDELRRRLHALRGDSELLLDSIPEARPDAVERSELGAQIDALQVSVRALGDAASALVVELGARDEEAANLVDRAVATRAGALRHAESVLRLSINAPGAWQPAGVRTRLRAGIAALARAQSAVTRFRNRLAAQR
jgi:hypothetical protein